MIENKNSEKDEKIEKVDLRKPKVKMAEKHEKSIESTNLTHNEGNKNFNRIRPYQNKGFTLIDLLKFQQQPISVIIEKLLIVPLKKKIENISENLTKNTLMVIMGGLLVSMCAMLKSSLRMREWTKSIA